MEELPEVLWAYRTTKQSPTEDIPFALTFRTKVVARIEVEVMTLRVQDFDSNHNEEGLQLSLDLLEERKNRAEITMNTYKRKTAQFSSKKLKS